MYNMYGTCGWASLLFLLTILYFPNKPKLPPSTSAVLARQKFGEGFKIFFTKEARNFWKLCIPFSLIGGWVSIWGAMIDVIVANDGNGVSEKQAGWMGFIGSVGGQFFALLVSKVIDKFPKKDKMILIILMTLASLGCLVFCLNILQIWKFNILLMYTSFLTITFAVNVSYPIWYEMMCESAFPIEEGTSAGLANWIYNVVGAIGLFILYKPSLGVNWTNWTLLVIFILSIPCLLFFERKDTRRGIDVYISAADI